MLTSTCTSYLRPSCTATFLHRTLAVHMALLLRLLVSLMFNSILWVEDVKFFFFFFFLKMLNSEACILRLGKTLSHSTYKIAKRKKAFLKHF